MGKTVMDKPNVTFDESLITPSRAERERFGELYRKASEVDASAEDEAAYYNDEAVPAVSADDDNEPLRCALSGIVILDDDETLYDDMTEEYVLRRLILPPRPAEDEDEDEPQAATG
jgi:hypothetical protein